MRVFTKRFFQLSSRDQAATVDAIRLGGALEALVLDPVYSGKGLAGLLSDELCARPSHARQTRRQGPG